MPPRLEQRRLEQRALLDRLDIVADATALNALIERIIGSDAPLTIGFVNQHAFNLYGRDAGFRAALDDVDILLRDGVGISALLRMLSLRAGMNMNGTDFIPRLARIFLQRVPRCSAHAYGTASPWLERGAKNLFGANFAATLLDGFAAPEYYVREFRGGSPEKKFVVLAMGMPKQEKIAAQLKRSTQGAAVIICGGAILDFCANKVPRAPRWVRALRLEWLFRLAREPRRLFSRYVSGGIRFAATMAMLAIEEKSGAIKSERKAALRIRND